MKPFPVSCLMIPFRMTYGPPKIILLLFYPQPFIHIRHHPLPLPFIPVIPYNPSLPHEVPAAFLQNPSGYRLIIDL
jgi:hypothetical protein